MIPRRLRRFALGTRADMEWSRQTPCDQGRVAPLRIGTNHARRRSTV